MAYNFDSDFYPMMVRVEAGPGIIVHFGENSDFEGVFKVDLDSDYVVAMINEHATSGGGLDSETVANMVREHSPFTDSDLGVVSTLRNEVDQLRSDADSDSTRIQALQETVDNLQVLLDSDQTELLDIIQRLDSDMIAIEVLKRNADSDALRIKSLVSTLDSDGRLLEKVIQLEEDYVIHLARHDYDDLDIRNNLAKLTND